MTFHEWEAKLLENLTSLSEQEKQKILDYYREIYSDKTDAGYSNKQILDEFGSPEECAKKILLEESEEQPQKEQQALQEEQENSEPRQSLPERAQAVISNVVAEATEFVKTRRSVYSWIGLFFLTIFIFIPLFAVFVSLIASFFAVTVSTFAVIIAGVIYAIAYPILGAIYGSSVGGILLNVGTGLVASAVSIFLSFLFALLTKQSVLLTVKTFRALYLRRVKK